MKKTARISIPDRSSPGLPRTAPSVAHQDRGRKYATDVKHSKIRARNTIIGTWNVRTLRAAGKVEELTHEMSRYQWHIIGLCDVRWKNMGETTTQEDHKLYYSGKQDKHEHGVGFLVHKDTVNTVISCQPVSSRRITIRLRATPFNITVVQAYAPTSDCTDEAIEELLLVLLLLL